MTPETGASIRPVDIDLRFTPARSARTIERVVDDDLLLLDPGSGSAHVVNSTGRIFWSALDGQTTLQELTEDLADAIGTPVDDLIEPVLGWVRALGTNGLLDGVAPSESDLLGIAGAVPEGEPFPTITGERLDGGDVVRLPVLGTRRSVLVNWSFSCGYCLGMVDDLAEARTLLDAQGWDVSLLVTGMREDVEAAALHHGLADVVVLREPTGVADDPFHDLGTPVAYVVDGDGVVSEPLAYGAVDVPAALRRLAGLAPVPIARLPPTEDEAVVGDGGPSYLALPPSAGVCAPSGSKPARTWTDVDTFLIGDVVVGIRAASASASDLVRRLLAPSAYDGEIRQPNYSVVLPSLDDPSSRELNLLLWGDAVVVRSRSARRVVDALLAFLSAHVAAEASAIWRIAAFPVVKEGHAALLPDWLRSGLAQVQPRLTRAGLAMVDGPCAIVDTGSAELVVPAPTIEHDEVVFNLLGPVVVRGTELLPAAPGRYPLAGWLFPDPGPETGSAATSLALAVAAVDRPKDGAMLADVAALLRRVPLAVASDVPALVTQAARCLASR